MWAKTHIRRLSTIHDHLQGQAGGGPPKTSHDPGAMAVEAGVI